MMFMSFPEGSIYSNELILEISKDLGLDNEILISGLKENLDEAAGHFIWYKCIYKNTLNISKEKKKLSSYIKSLEKSKSFFNEIYKNEFSHFHFMTALKETDCTLDQEKQLLLDYTSSNKKGERTKDLNKLLDILIMSSKKALVNIDEGEVKGGAWLRFPRKNKTDQVLSWISFFLHFWHSCSKVTISEGRYNESSCRYESKAISIVEKIVIPVNNKLREYNNSSNELITNSQIFEAIKAYRIKADFSEP